MGLSRTLAGRVAAVEAALLPTPAERPGAATEELLRRLGALAERLRKEPGWREPTPAEAAEDVARLRAYFAERFGEETAERFAAALEGRDG